MLKIKDLKKMIEHDNPEADVCFVVKHSSDYKVYELDGYRFIEEDGSGIIFYLREFPADGGASI